MSAPKPMSIFGHYVANCAIAHQEVVRALRSQASDREVSRLTIALIHKMHRLETLVAEMGAGAVFGTPGEEIGVEAAKRFFP